LTLHRLLVIGIVLVTLNATLGPARAQGDGPVHARQGFMIGLGLGGGSAVEDIDGGPDQDRAGGGAAAFRLGFGVSPSLVIGLESTAWLRQDDDQLFGETVDVTTTLTTSGVALTWFPAPEGGFFVRGGLGFGRVAVELERGNVKAEASESGFGILFGIGHEWRLTRSFALGIEGDFAVFGISDLDVGEDETADVSYNYANLNLTGTWYFGN